ncbi:MAG: hypothetical protein EHM48_03750 [Planctomycetaceae bacterium]|nr:MAG: hypothetical protein EHM48_03750 [Planctomycetaceae bacterium]
MNEQTNRRNFLRAAGRGVAGLALAAITGGLLLGRRSGATEQACVNRGICGGCGTFETCGLPAALSARQSQQSNKQGGRQ